MMNNQMFGMGDLCLGIIEAGIALLIGLYVFYRNQDKFILNL